MLKKHRSRHKKAGARPAFLCLAEREGFEPSIELLTLYSLSRGAPSASRASLQNFVFRTSLTNVAESRDTDLE
jgi:hypothetical protein